MEVFVWYLIASYCINLLFVVILAVNDYKSIGLEMSIKDILSSLVVLIMSPISVWIMIFHIIQSTLPEDFWSRPIINFKKK